MPDDKKDPASFDFVMTKMGTSSNRRFYQARTNGYPPDAENHAAVRRFLASTPCLRMIALDGTVRIIAILAARSELRHIPPELSML